MANKISTESDWLPLLSDPQSLTELAHKVGLDEKWALTEIFDLDEELLKLVPQPCIALILLFYNENEEKMPSSDQWLTKEPLFFLKQVPELGNSCGQIGIIHAIANNLDKGILKQDAILSQLINHCKNMNPTERGLFLAQYKELQTLHDEVALKGLEEESEVEVDYHYICLINHNNMIVELDGCKEQPVNRGATTPDTFFMDAISVVKKEFFEQYGGIDFVLMSLGPATD